MIRTTVRKLMRRSFTRASAIIVAGYTAVLNPQGIVIGGSSLFPGGSLLILSNTPISLAASGVLLIGSSSTTLPAQSVFDIGCQTFADNSTGFLVSNAETSPSGPAQTVDDTIISLDQSGALAIGSMTLSLPTPTSDTSIDSTIVVAGQTITLNPSAFSVAGTTISLGGGPPSR